MNYRLYSALGEEILASNSFVSYQVLHIDFTQGSNASKAHAMTKKQYLPAHGNIF